MKKIRFILIAVSLISFCALSGPVVAQEKSKEEKEKELRMQEEIDAQKKAISEQKKAQIEVQNALQDSQKEVDKAMKEAQQQLEATDKYKDMVRVFRGTGDRSRFGVEPFPVDQFMFTPGMEGFNWYSHSGDNERTSWDFSKSVKESSFSRDYVFDVDLSSTVVMSVNGECKNGEIRIKIVMPNGKVYSDIMIDE
ncbi:MAG: hypothetical protein NTY95_02515 [Bacteroidia bacterium]|nr:hypothetical protein [Bacteroidia bacterium]